MPNNATAKLKLLYLYDYFLRYVKPEDESKGVYINDLLEELKKNRIEVERKSFYSDLDKLNEFIINVIGREFKGSQDKWIYQVEGKKGCYTRHAFKDELTEEELQLVVDAIMATPFTKSELVKKLMATHPSYNGVYKSFYPNDQQTDKALSGKLFVIRQGIEEQQSIKFSYGYADIKSSKAITHERHVSPAALRWDGNQYYLIAVDNERYYDELSKLCEDEGIDKKTSESQILDLKLKCARTFRLDRVVGRAVDYETDETYKYVSLAPKDNKNKDLIKKHLSGSVHAFTGKTMVHARIRVEVKPEDANDDKAKELVLKAYNNFFEKVSTEPAFRGVKGSFSEGFAEFNFQSSDVPTLYTAIFELLTYGLKVQIIPFELNGSRYMDDNVKDYEYVKEKFYSYAKVEL